MTLDDATVAHLARTRTVDLITTGRKSGETRAVEIWWFHFEGRFIVTGTPGRRDWLANVNANPRVAIRTRFGEFSGTAVLIDDPDFRHRFFSDRATRWYVTQAELRNLVETAPMIEIDLDGETDRS
jgi:deazaflavin-dependent oxidoreductase (nitroreductase family)